MIGETVKRGFKDLQGRYAAARRGAAPVDAGSWSKVRVRDLAARGAAADAAALPPNRATLESLIRLKPAGESLKLATPRVQALGSGGHLSAFKGRGVEFDESRPYQPGDDLRTMDWRVTARTGKAYTKVFREERNRPVIVWLDLRSPMLFGTRGVYKGVRAAEAAAIIAWSAVANGDRFGGLVFSESEHHELRPALGRRAALRLMQLVSSDFFWSAQAPDAADGNAERSLLRLTRVARPGSLTFLLSDFRGLGPEADRHFRQLASHGDVFLMNFYDPVEAELPPPGRYRIKAGGRTFSVDTGDAALRKRYREQFEARRARLDAVARLPGVHVLHCVTTDDPRMVLAQRFRSS